MQTFLFHILRMFRFFIVNVAKVLSGLLTLGVILAIFSDNPPETFAVIIWIIFAILLSILAWYYDALLRKLEPDKTKNQEWS